MSKRIGIIGAGNRVTGVWEENLKDLGLDLTLAAVADPDGEGVRKRLEQKGLWHEELRIWPDAETMLDREKLDAVIIGTRCSLHARYAALVMERGLPLFLEKPVATTDADLNLLRETAAWRTAPVLVSFPLRAADIAREAKRIIDSGALGVISQIQAVNNVWYGRGYYKKWYRDDGETGGLFLQKATHDLDCIFYLTGFRPTRVCAMKSKVIYRGDHPAGLRCRDCSEQYTCPESSWVLEHRFGEAPQPDACSFAVDTGNEDSGSLLLEFDNGVHAAYTQNFVVRKDAGKRLFRVIGFEATLEFDFITGILKVFHHQRAETETRVFNGGSNHFGGDRYLMASFLEMLYEGKKPCATIEDGLLSALVCLRARQSSEEGRFRDIRFET